MDANLNSISPLLSEKVLPERVSKTDLKKENGPSFNTVLNKAEEKQTVKEPISKEPVKQSVREQRVDSQKVEDVETPRSNSLQSHRENEESVPMKATEEVQTPVKSKIDDKAGVVAESFDHMAVSYPVSKIAKESLDEKTVTNLKDQGLWDLPSMVMAQPSQQLALMKEAIAVSSDVSGEELGTEVGLPVVKPLAQFMASLESELGVKPDRLIQAFKNLSPDQLQASPKETMAQVVKNLNLNPKDAAHATELFTKMLSQMEAMSNQSMNPALLAAIAGGVTQNALSVDGKVSDKANEKAVVGTGTAKARTQVASARYAQNAGSLEKGLGAESKVPTEQVEAPSREAMAIKPEKTLKNNSQPPANIVDSKVETPVPQVQGETPAAVLTQQSNIATPDTFKANAFAANSNSNAVNEKDVKELGKSFKDTKVSVKSVEGAQASSTQVAANDFAPAKAEVPGQAVVTSGIATGELKAGSDSKQEAIRSIVNQAQMLAQKGGGEVHMSLKPDHLGEIQLKVAMEGNHVNVQMTTEHSEVKKLIEQSIHELRSGLASHNLNMDKLDVSVGNRDTQGFSKGQPDFGAARDFANQFHQQQNNRREFMDNLSSLRGSAQKSMTTMDRAAQAQRTMSARSSSSGRLNVVA